MRFQRSKQYGCGIRGRDWLYSGDKPALSVMVLVLIGACRRQTKRASFQYTGFGPLKGLDVTRYLVPLSRKLDLFGKQDG